MTGGNNVNTQFYRSVKLEMNRREMARLTPFHRGLDICIYEPVVDGHNLLHLPGYNKDKINWVDMTITARNINVQPLHERDMHAIDEELARLDSMSGFKILKDHLKYTDNHNLIHEKQPIDTLTVHTVLMDHPHLDGQNDHWRSKATDIHTVIMPLEEVKALEQSYEKRKAFFPQHRFMLKDVKKAPNDPLTNKPMVELKVGKI